MPQTLSTSVKHAAPLFINTVHTCTTLPTETLERKAIYVDKTPLLHSQVPVCQSSWGVARLGPTDITVTGLCSSDKKKGGGGGSVLNIPETSRTWYRGLLYVRDLTRASFRNTHSPFINESTAHSRLNSIHVSQRGFPSMCMDTRYVEAN